MAKYVEVTRKQFEAVLPEGTCEVDLPGIYEHVYEYPYHCNDDLVIRVFSSLSKLDGKARKKGRDAIRVVVVSRKLGRIIKSMTRVNRVSGWEGRLIERMRAGWRAASHADRNRCPRCGSYMIEKHRRGKRFLGCVTFPKCRGTYWFEPKKRT